MVDNKFLVLMIGIFLIGFASAGTTYTENSETNCYQGECTQTIYSDIHFLYEEGQWKTLDQIKSFKGTSIEITIIEDDKDYPVEVVDYNLTSLTVKLNPKGLTIFNKDVPIRLWEVNEIKQKDYEDSLATGSHISKGNHEYQESRDKTYEENIKYNLLNQEDERTFNFGIGDVLQFGMNSTTITLQTSGSENLGDTLINQGAASTNFGTGAGVAVGANDITNRWGLFKFNVSMLSPTDTINTANLSLYLDASYITGAVSFDIGSHRIYDSYTWVETDPTWNTRPTNTSEFNITQEADLNFAQGVSADVWYDFQVTDMLQDVLNSGTVQNLSIYLKSHDYVGGTDVNDVVDFRSRNHATAGTRPKLQITYSAPVFPPNATITYPVNGTTYLLVNHFNWTFQNTSALDVCQYSLNGASNVSVTCTDLNKSITSAEGDNNIIFTLNDTDGNSAFTQNYYTIDTISPNVTNLIESPTDPTNYSQTTIYRFNATVDDSSPINSVLFEIEGVNYTATNLSSNMFQASLGNLSAGTHTYRWFANDSLGNFNNSVTGSYTVDKATTVLGLTATTPITYGTATDFAGSGCPAELTCSLDISNNVYAAGTITGNYSTAGNANLSSAYANFTVTINQATLSGTIAGAATITFGDIANITGNETNNNDSDVGYILYRDNVSVSNPDNTILAAGTYNYIYNSTGGQNYTANPSLDTFTLTVNKAPGVVFAYVGNLRTNYAGDNVTAKNEILNGTLINGTGDISMYLNGSLINYGASPLFNITDLEVGSYYINVTVNETANYTYDDERWSINITVFYVSNLTGQFNINENQGIIEYDVTGEWNNGTISGATWANDGIEVTLTQGVDYDVEVTTGVFSIISPSVDRAELDITYVYFVYGDDSFGRTMLLLLAGFMMIFCIYIIYMFYRKSYGELKYGVHYDY